MLKKIEEQSKISFTPLEQTLDEDADQEFKTGLQDSSSSGSMVSNSIGHNAATLLSPERVDSPGEADAGKEKDLYVLAATHLKEGHISKIDERPESEDAMSQSRNTQSRDMGSMQSSTVGLPLNNQLGSYDGTSPQNRLGSIKITGNVLLDN